MDISRVNSPYAILKALCMLKQHDLLPPKQAKGTVTGGCLDYYQRHGVLDLARFFSSARKVKSVKVNRTKAPVLVQGLDPRKDEFLSSYRWRKLRYEALKLNNGCCCLCSRGRPHGVVLHVDHIKPRRTHPELALVLDNLQVLCEDCNHGKGNWDSTDWR